MCKKIKENKIECKNCGDIIESKNVHNFVQCTCENVAVDGGKEYLKRTFPNGKPEDWYEELSTFEEE